MADPKHDSAASSSLAQEQEKMKLKIDSGQTFWIGTSWKMNKLRTEAIAFATSLHTAPILRTKSIQPFVIPPFPYIADVARELAGTTVRVGAQNMHWTDSGAWTGEVSAPMLKDCGATLVELGHSERRTHFGETDDTVGLKVEAALRHGLTALVCVGDTRSDYETGATAAVLARQVQYALKRVGTKARNAAIIAYEPVWSIGEGGTPAAPDFVSDQHRKIKELTASLTGEPLPVIYGGSVNLDNCVALASRAHVDGLFIGRAAWQAGGYLGIIAAVQSAIDAAQNYKASA